MPVASRVSTDSDLIRTINRFRDPGNQIQTTSSDSPIPVTPRPSRDLNEGLIVQPDQPKPLDIQGIKDPSGSQADSAGALTKSIGRAPTLGLQKQQQVSGQDIGRLLQRSNQFEATTGREVTGQLTEGLSRAAFGEAADRAAQNKSLALDEFRTELSAFGLDADTQLKTASTILNAQGQDRQFALARFASDLQTKGFGADQAFRLAQQSIDVQIQNEQNRIQREAIAKGVSADKANARAQGIGTLLNLGVTAAAFAAFSERALKNNIVPFQADENELNLEEVKKLPLYHFKYIGHQEHMMGAMTDEMPESIKADEGRQVNLYSLNTMLLSAVKSLIGRVEELEAMNGVS